MIDAVLYILTHEVNGEIYHCCEPTKLLDLVFDIQHTHTPNHWDRHHLNTTKYLWRFSLSCVRAAVLLNNNNNNKIDTTTTIE